MIRFATISDLPYIKALAEQYQQVVYGKITDRTLDEINNISLVNGVTYVYDTPQGVFGFLTVERHRMLYFG